MISYKKNIYFLVEWLDEAVYLLTTKTMEHKMMVEQILEYITISRYFGKRKPAGVKRADNI